MKYRLFVVPSAALTMLGVYIGCGASSNRSFDTTPTDPNEAGLFDPDADIPDAPEQTHDPESCEEAAAAKSYVGCDYWPTVTANPVPSVFDYAVVVSNTGSVAADVTVTGPSAVDIKRTVAPGTLETIYLPWVSNLKGPEVPYTGGPAIGMDASVGAAGGAYHVKSSVPVIVAQFNALEYKGVGGPPGKDWTSCGPAFNCFSFTNDASLLLPSTAWSTNYRVTGVRG